MKMKIVVISVLATLLSCSVIIFFVIPRLRVPICKGSIFPFIRPHVELFCPPLDLYKGLIDEIVDFSDEYTYIFKIKYIGPYELDMVFDHIDNLNENCNVKAQIDFYLKDTLMLSRYIMIEGNKESSECYFIVPKDLPIDKEITCKIKILSAEGKCKTIRFLLSRQSQL
ncbi:MAG: hypothetical protein A2Y12_06800 [Planctomycetes bacterium GWF2_42_9]|nr:MAG: hypothetical protein A2Y12_06800 [Planctomycetes bacterium GWF2_42_9]